MPRVDTEALREAGEDAVLDLIERGYSTEVAITTAAAVLEVLDDAVPALDRAIDEDGYASIIDWLRELLTNPERKARRSARIERKRQFLTAAAAGYEAGGATAKEARRKARRDWRKSR